MKTSSLKKNQANTATLSLSDFSRIKNSLIPQKTEEHERKELESTLKQISQSKMKNWPDSIEMAKKLKLESRKKIFFEKEAEKRKIDEEERKFNEMEKKIIIERANKLLFEAQDPVKSFHSKLLLADVMKEREYQMEIKQKKKEIEDRINEKWKNVESENLHNYDMKELQKLEVEKIKKEDQMNVINQQLQDFKIKKIKEYQDRVIEGEIIKQRAKEALIQEKEKEDLIRSKAKKQQETFIKANIELEKLKEVKKIQEQEVIKRNEEFAIKKQQMVDLRKRKEAEKFKEKQDTRQKLIDKQIEYLNNLKSKEDEILNKQVKEAEEKKNKEIEEKQRKFNELKVNILINNIYFRNK